MALILPQAARSLPCIVAMIAHRQRQSRQSRVSPDNGVARIDGRFVNSSNHAASRGRRSRKSRQLAKLQPGKARRERDVADVHAASRRPARAPASRSSRRASECTHPAAADSAAPPGGAPSPNGARSRRRRCLARQPASRSACQRSFAFGRNQLAARRATCRGTRRSRRSRKSAAGRAGAAPAPCRAGSRRTRARCAGSGWSRDGRLRSARARPTSCANTSALRAYGECV